MANGSTFVPSAPFRALLEKRLAQLNHGTDESSPMERLAFESGLGIRSLYRVLRASGRIEFRVADTIVTKLYGPMLWHEDETLSEIYRTADLAKEDLLCPLEFPSALAEADRVLIEAWDNSKTRGEAATKLDISLPAFSKLLDRALQRAGRERTKPRVLKPHRQSHEEWKAANAEFVREYDRKRSNEKYANDPEYRARKLEQQRRYREKKRAAALRVEALDVIEDVA